MLAAGPRAVIPPAPLLLQGCSKQGWHAELVSLKPFSIPV